MADAPDYSPEDWLLRRVFPRYVELNPTRPTRQAFQPLDGIRMSTTLYKSANDVDALLAGHEEYGVVAIRVSDLGEYFAMEWDPIDGNENHFHVKRADGGGRFSKGAQRKLSASSQWVKLPDIVDGEVELLTFD